MDEREGSQNEEIKAMRDDPSKKKEVAERMLGKSATFPVKLEAGKTYTVTVETAADEMRVSIDGKAVAFLQSPGIGHETKSKIELGVAVRAVGSTTSRSGTPHRSSEGENPFEKGNSVSDPNRSSGIDPLEKSLCGISSSKRNANTPVGCRIIRHGAGAMDKNIATYLYAPRHRCAVVKAGIVVGVLVTCGIPACRRRPVSPRADVGFLKQHGCPRRREGSE
jgi:hypothetical protein